MDLYGYCSIGKIHFPPFVYQIVDKPIGYLIFVEEKKIRFKDQHSVTVIFTGSLGSINENN